MKDRTGKQDRTGQGRPDQDNRAGQGRTRTYTGQDVIGQSVTGTGRKGTDRTGHTQDKEGRNATKE